MRILCLFFTAFVFGRTVAQPLFTLTPDSIFVSKPASSFTMYNYAQFENLSGDSLDMRWVKLQTIASYPGGHGGEDLGDWDISIQDPINFYNPANEVDSADFVLQPMANSTDKFIMQLYPNGQEGSLKVDFKIFALDDPTNFIILHFDYTATASTLATGEVAATTALSFYPNPVADWLQVQNNGDNSARISLFSPQGKFIKTLCLDQHATTVLEMADFPVGMYVLECEGEWGRGGYTVIKI